MFLFKTKKALTTTKMVSTYGRVGTEEEWQNNAKQQTTQATPTNPPPGTTNYTSRLQDPKLKAKVLKFVEEYWWEGLCLSANHDKFLGGLFEPTWFDQNEVLEFGHPAYSKIVMVLCLSYLHIVEKWGEEDMANWKTHWTSSEERGPFIFVINPDAQEQHFGMGPPRGGWLDFKSELAESRRRRERGEVITFPEYKRHDSTHEPSSSTEPNNANGSIVAEEYYPDMEMESVMLEDTKSETSGMDNEDWMLIESDDANFEEAKMNGAKNHGYVYRVEDAQQGRKGWFGLLL